MDFNIGDYVVAIKSTSRQFTAGRIYRVSNVRRGKTVKGKPLGEVLSISVERDDKGDPNGWGVMFFKSLGPYLSPLEKVIYGV